MPNKEPLLHILNSYLYHLSSKKGEKAGVGINESNLFCLTFSVAKDSLSIKLEELVIKYKRISDFFSI